ncbi:hypothetical protein J6590_097256 [Homalodisca vitripennis]|nr:hypothetical protein J6590_097256 [Homalodisca vitripennis]
MTKHIIQRDVGDRSIIHHHHVQATPRRTTNLSEKSVFGLGLKREREVRVFDPNWECRWPSGLRSWTLSLNTPAASRNDTSLEFHSCRPIAEWHRPDAITRRHSRHLYITRFSCLH